jgi:hypothetical protein
MAEMIFLARPGAGFGYQPAQDALTGGLIEMLKTCTDNIPLWLIFACQVHLGVRYILETQVDRPLSELLTAGQRLRTTSEGYIDDSLDHIWGPDEHESLKQNLDELDTFVFTD